jgi:glyoxylase-like metal-dependent hydrolase (beta-lactamase superfamily II)
MVKSRLALILGAWMWSAAPLHAQTNPDWTTPVAPFHIAGNLYYVGSQDLASYLIVTPKGDILINSSLEASVPLIRASIEQLGFKFNAIKVLLISHAHFDHDAGSAEVLRQTGAKYMVMDGDVGLQCDVFLGAHGGYFGMLAKLDRIKAGAKENVWVDNKGYQGAVAEREQAFETELKRQKN